MSHSKAREANIMDFDKQKAEIYDLRDNINRQSIVIANLISRFDPEKQIHELEHNTFYGKAYKTVGDETKEGMGIVKDDLPEKSPFLCDKKVLDFACGTGLVSEILASFLGGNGNLVGIDISESVLEKFSEKAKKFEKGVMSSFLYDILDPKFNKTKILKLPQVLWQSFNVVICSLSFHHMHDIPAITKALVRFLAPGGWLLVVDFYADSQCEVGLNGAVQHKGGMSIESMNSAFSEAGLINVGSRPEVNTKQWQHPSFVKHHCSPDDVERMERGELTRADGIDGDVFLVEKPLIMACGQRLL